jgi:hypothetical protein
MTRKKKRALIVLLVFLIVPFPMVVVGSWNLSVVNTKDEPIKGIEVIEEWHTTLWEIQSKKRENKLISGKDGYVAFPRQMVITNIFIATVNVVSQIPNFFKMCPEIPSTWVFVNVPETKNYKSASFGGAYGFGEKPNKIVLQPQE